MTSPGQKKPGHKRDQPQPHSRLQEERVAELLDIAVEAFITHGFEGASINEIAKRANSSKTTFYSRFPTKEKLFIAVLERRMDLIFSQVSTALPVDPPIEETLKEYGSRLLQFALSQDQIALFRVVSMESPRFPELGERFYELGPKRGHAFLSDYLEEQIRRERLIKEDAALMAEHLISLLTGGPVRWLVLGLQRNPIAKDGQRHVDAAVRVFLRAYAKEAIS
jgi:TetR/AcrR family transcriptional repressor of mexJK operon